MKKNIYSPIIKIDNEQFVKVTLGDFVCASLKKHKRYFKQKIKFREGDVLTITHTYKCTDGKPTLKWKDIIGCYGGDKK